MNSKLKRIFVPLLSWVALVALACTCAGLGAAEPTPTPLPPPTQAPPTKAPPTKPPIKAPTDTPEVNIGGNAAITISAEPYSHPSGAFSIRLPEGWEVNERNYSVGAVESSDGASVTMYFDNVGVQFDTGARDKYINAVEANFYGTYSNYQLSSQEEQSDGSIGVFKTIDLNGASFHISSYYWQVGAVMYIQDLWIPQSVYDSYIDPLLEVANSVQVDETAGANAPLYPLRYTFKGPNDLFQFDIPYGWEYTTGSAENTIVDTFKSPDGHSFIDNLTYDDGKEISRSAAGKVALSLLKQFYADDLKVVDDKVQQDGSERLSWRSNGKNVVGQTFFEVRGTTFLLLTWVVDNDFYDFNQPIWSDVLASYKIP
jgi:hypothetical protein